MASYRYGLKSNILNEEWYAIEKKLLFFWAEVYTFSSKQKMLDVVEQLKKNNNIVFEA